MVSDPKLEGGLRLVPDRAESWARAREHWVHFYQTKEALAEVVASFFADGVALGASLLAIATGPHRDLLAERLSAAGVDVVELQRGGRLTFVDADEMLSRIMVGASLDRDRARTELGGLVAHCAPPPGDGAQVRAYGEMMDVLWARGMRQAALDLEETWNELQRTHPLSLLCAYSMGSEVLRASVVSEQPVSAPRAANIELALRAEISQHCEIEKALRDALRELRGAERSARDAERHLEAIVDALPVLVSYIDRDERYRFVNHTYERWFGRPKSDFVGKRVRDVLEEEPYERVRDQLARAFAGDSLTFEAHLAYRGGGERDVEATYAPHFGADGTAAGIVELVADVGQRRALETARQNAVERTERLTRITSAIADAVTPDQVFEAVVDRVAAAVGASSAGLWMLQDDGALVAFLRGVGYSEAARRRFHGVEVGSDERFPALDVITSGEPVWLSSQAELLARYPNLATATTPTRVYRVCCVPVVVNGWTRGALGLTFDSVPDVDREQRDFLMLVARYCGQALERLRLLDAERKSRARAERAAVRTGVLSRASRAFSEASHDLPKLLQTIVEQVSGDYADGCTVTLVNQAGVLELVAAHHRDPAAVDLVRELLTREPLRVGEGLTGHVAATGEALLVSKVDREELLRAVRPVDREWVDRFLPASLIVVPLRVRGRVLGTLSAFRCEGRAEFVANDELLLEELAERATMAIESGRLYEDIQHARMRAELLYGLAESVIRAERLEQVFEAALSAIERGLTTNRSSILTYDGRGVMRFRAWRGLSEEYRAAVEGHSPWQRHHREPQPILVADAENDPAMAPYLQLLRREGIAALAFIPLVESGRLIGKFMVYYDRRHALGAHELEMARAIANHVAAAVARFAALEELQQTVRFNEIFTGILGHDLRNPLGAIMASAQLALKRSDGERSTKPLARILTSGERMARMIDQLLDFTRVRLGTGIPLQRRPLDLVRLVRQVADEFEVANPNCVLELEESGDSRGHWDADRLSQVFSNLIGNALQHGAAEPGVRVTVDGNGSEHVRVHVRNVGTIPTAILPKIFDPMFGGERRHARSDGLGLGLYITRQIVIAHGGHIDVRSGESGATTFTVALPRSPRLG